jgi:hypothetical protein
VDKGTIGAVFSLVAFLVILVYVATLLALARARTTGN